LTGHVDEDCASEQMVQKEIEDKKLKQHPVATSDQFNKFYGYNLKNKGK